MATNGSSRLDCDGPFVATHDGTKQSRERIADAVAHERLAPPGSYRRFPCFFPIPGAPPWTTEVMRGGSARLDLPLVPFGSRRLASFSGISFTFSRQRFHSARVIFFRGFESRLLT